MILFYCLVLATVFDPVNGVVVIRHLDSVGITGEGIFTALKEVIENIQVSFSNILRFVSDTCNLMKGTHSDI